MTGRCRTGTHCCRAPAYDVLFALPSIGDFAFKHGVLVVTIPRSNGYIRDLPKIGPLGEWLRPLDEFHPFWVIFEGM